jgi:hypothetical protein
MIIIMIIIIMIMIFRTGRDAAMSEADQGSAACAQE